MAYDLVARLKLDDRMSPKLKKAIGTVNSASSTIDRVNTSTSRMQRLLGGAGVAFRTMGTVGNRAFNGLLSGSRGVLNSIFSIRSAIVGLGASYALIAKPLQLASDMEQAEVAFTTMLGSAEKSSKFLADLMEFANTTPFELPELRDSAKKMLAFGFSAEQVLPTLTAVGNASAGLGLGGDGVDRITRALGQMRAKSKVSAEEMLQLTEAGVPAWEMLANNMGVTTAEVMDLSSKGLIPADKAINALIDGMNKKFPDMMQKQSRTLAGLWSTVKDTFNNRILLQWGEGISEAIKPRLEALTRWLDNNGTTIERWGRKLKNISLEATDWLMTKFEDVYSYLDRHFFSNPEFQSIEDFQGKIDFIVGDIGDSLRTWYHETGAPALEEYGGKAARAFASGLKSALKTAITEHPLLAALLGGLVATKVASWVGTLKVQADNLRALTGCCCDGPGGAAAGKGGKDKTPDGSGSKSSKILGLTGAGAALLGGLAATGYSASVWEAAQNDPNMIFSKNIIGNGTNAVTEPPNVREKALQEWGFTDGYAGGLSYVPYDGFPAVLHKGERVMTAGQNDAYTNGSGGSSDNTFNISINYQSSGSMKQDARELVQEMVVELEGLKGAVFAQ